MDSIHAPVLAPLTRLLAQKSLPPGPPVARPGERGARVRVWTGALGTYLGRTRDGWCRVALDGEHPRVDEWQPWQVEAVRA